ncbi:MAG TPA: L-aspartate oxidase [Acetivibrio sp.]|uniref:L-aspartate oxidase n=1 Tax=Acetivibrio sp. TaxID=1872092 RepID=UPI002C9D41D6|nr:L-aspartate oxidase [Acetivibrio sp.]HOM03063.1 L-aspartate oxidase [Acetivibrio sp.]
MDGNRYLVDFDTDEILTEHHDVVIIGSGIAGVYTALEIPEKYDVVILTKETIEISNSVLAQGGIAVSLDKGDSPELHFKDTIYAGAGLCDEKSVWVLVNEAAANIETLCKFGVNFDRKSKDELSLTREGAHSKNRIIHAGDTTGKEVCDKLISVVRTRENVKIKERVAALDLITEDNVCKGVLAYDEDSSSYIFYRANVVVCATGGFGQLYSNTTNPEVATGDGAGLAYRAGAELMDLEFVQFHPTVLFHPENKSFLISEAVRGEGAILRNINGERFMPKYHEMKELAPRDIVSRSIFHEMNETNSTHVYLDITFKDKEYLEQRFPNIYKTCLSYGIDISKDYIPVAPAEHYCMGGIRTDVFGRTNIKGFYACGEVACNGIHGANRLASNSLLEGLVFGHKIGKEVENIIENSQNVPQKVSVKAKSNRVEKNIDVNKIKKDIQETMTQYVGIVREKEGLEKAKKKVDEYYELIKGMKNTSVSDFEIQNIVLISKLVIESALERKESRGAHFRLDYQKTDDENWKRNIIKRKF